ncbi:MAG TPA: cytochrome c oxidase assembly protein [Arenimonas sp.]|jgi:cytochrome c oxidase assembly protein subunit 11|nr:cytochrome c oxidase assembly protein [Arenimonas sp.]HPO25026.1 cytochrome c oxidase assembly protein [Arenimonas sp.]HPW32003.1 cytochrome c oxidase assembly protein [Arenimonas sp.]
MKPEVRKTLKNVALISVCSFAFAFSMVPLYNIACEKIFGIKMEKGPTGEETLAGAKINKNRKITVEFDGTVNSKLPWDFQPSQLTMEVVPGKMYDTHYIAKNNAPYAVVGNAAPSVTPVVASSFFNKTECFCFTQQLLKAGEQRDMPVRFVINPNLPEDVHTITLSYTFFINDKATALAKAPSTSPTARSAP